MFDQIVLADPTLPNIGKDLGDRIKLMVAGEDDGFGAEFATVGKLLLSNLEVGEAGEDIHPAVFGPNFLPHLSQAR